MVKKLLQIVMLGMIGMTLLGSTVTCTDSEDRDTLFGISREYTAPTWSKDGLHLVFAHPPGGVFVVQADGTDMWSLPPGSPMGTQTSPGNFSPALSLDGTRVAYAMVSERGTTSAIVTSALDGSDLRKLTSDRATDAHPAWSPDGSQIAFYSNRETSSTFIFDLYIMDSDGSDERRLASSSSIAPRQPPVWSPDGSRIAFVSFQREPQETGSLNRHIVYTVRLDGSDLTELGDSASSLAWSPDGTQIAFIREGDETRGLYTMDPDGGNQRLLSSFQIDQGWHNNLSWSPDGSEILYGSGSDHSPALVVVVGVDGSEPRVLAEPRSTRGAAAWSPDGSRIAFHVISDNAISDDLDIVLHTMARDGSDPRVLVRGTLERLVAENSDWRDVSGDIAACSEGHVVKNPGRNQGLVQDCETLLGLRNALAGEAVLNWSAQVEISDWKGLKVGGSPPRVTGLWLSSSNLDPTQLTGVIPGELGDMANLEVLDLHFNQLTGSIPPELGNLTNLIRLVLGSNVLKGPIPSELGMLTKLETMDLSGNRLTGSIPEVLGNLENLETLDVSNTHLTGCVPEGLSLRLRSGQLKSLQHDGLKYWTYC